MNQTQQKPLGKRTRDCIACRRDPGLRYWHSADGVLCWPYWERVEHLDHKAAAVIAACQVFHCGGAEGLDSAGHDELAALVFLAADW